MRIGAESIYHTWRVNLDENNDSKIQYLVLILQAGDSLVHSRIGNGGYNFMSIQSAISGLLMLFAPVEEVAVAEKVYNSLMITSKVIEKTIEDTWKESAHEEGYQIAKDLILELGKTR